jgi:hypothetical protein
MEEILKNPFTWGLATGLVFAALIWKTGFTARRHANREITRLETEARDLRSHLNTQLSIQSTGQETLKAEVESLRRQAETLRVNLALAQQKPGRTELRQFQINEAALKLMREQAPGFAPAWEKAHRQAESEMESAESGLRKLVRRVLPGIGSPTTPVLLAHDEKAES